jgi:hypothetical protein
VRINENLEMMIVHPSCVCQENEEQASDKYGKENERNSLYIQLAVQLGGIQHQREQFQNLQKRKERMVKIER